MSSSGRRYGRPASSRTGGTEPWAGASQSADASRSRPGPLAALEGLARPVDLVAITAIPACLLIVFVLPEPVRRQLALSYVDPTLVGAFAAHFVHLDAGHLASNLAVYAFVVPVGYLLCVLSGRRSEFLVAFATFVFAFPLALSALNVALVRPRLGYGFSGVNTAFVGFLPVALFGFLSARLGTTVGPRDSPTLFFATTALVAAVAVPASPVTLSVAAVGALAAVAYLREWYPGLATVARRLGAVSRGRAGYVELAAVGAAAFVAFPFVAFPADPVGEGQILNVYAHLLGYALGFIASYVTFSLVGLDGDRGSCDDEPFSAR